MIKKTNNKKGEKRWVELSLKDQIEAIRDSNLFRTKVSFVIDGIILIIVGFVLEQTNNSLSGGVLAVSAMIILFGAILISFSFLLKKKEEHELEKLIIENRELRGKLKND